MRRLLALLLAAALVLSGCAGMAEQEDLEEDWESYQPYLPETPPEDAEDLGPAYPAAFSLPYHRDHTLDPVDCGEGIQETVSSLLYEPLFRLDRQFRPQPVLCESWEWDAAGLVCTLTLREGAAFSDGSALTARDVAETLQRAMASERFAYRLRNVASVSANRAGQVIITLTAPDRGLPALLDIPVVKRTTAGDRVPAGTGPYLLVHDEAGERLQAREDWWQGKRTPVDAIPLVHVKDRETALYLFSTHQVELVAADPTDDPSLASGQAEAAAQPTAVMQFIGFNTAEGRLFADASLRALFSRGIDRKTLVDAQLARTALAAQYPVSPLSPLYPAGGDAPYSEEETLAALRAAGQDTGEAKELTLLVSGGDGFRMAGARFIAEKLSLLDWRITVTELPWEEYLAALEAGEFDLYYGAVRLTANWDLSDLLGTEGALNYGAYANETTDMVLQAFAAAEDREAAAGRLWSHFRSVTPIAPVCFKNDAVLTHPGVAEGISPAPYGTFYGMEDWVIHLS